MLAGEAGHQGGRTQRVERGTSPAPESGDKPPQSKGSNRIQPKFRRRALECWSLLQLWGRQLAAVGSPERLPIPLAGGSGCFVGKSWPSAGDSWIAQRLSLSAGLVFWFTSGSRLACSEVSMTTQRLSSSASRDSCTPSAISCHAKIVSSITHRHSVSSD